ncbi:hypothetical protein GCM10010252_25760 [Streptomyces aureoverticillatus]|nr:hypothetical protein GCM10010252_25760 [Streptomyces aureoverticillatus]
MRAVPITMRFSVRSYEPATEEHVRPQPGGTLLAEAHRVSGPLGMRSRRLVAGPTRGVRARATHLALLGLA